LAVRDRRSCALGGVRGEQVKKAEQARPVCHRKRDSIEACLTIVFAALAVSR